MTRKKKKPEPPPYLYMRSMTPEAFRHAIKMLGMSQLAAGRFIGVSGRTARRYGNGQAVIPPAAVLLLRSLLHHGDTPVVPRWMPDQN